MLVLSCWNHLTKYKKAWNYLIFFSIMNTEMAEILLKNPVVKWLTPGYDNSVSDMVAAYCSPFPGSANSYS